MTLLDLECGVILEFDEARASLEPHLSYQWPRSLDASRWQVFSDEWLGSLRAADSAIALSSMAERDAASFGLAFDDLGFASGLTAAIQGRDTLLGVLGVYDTSDRIFRAIDRQFVQSTADLIAQSFEHRRMREALDESEARYRSLFKDSRDAVYVTSRVGEVIDMNPAGLELFGYSRKELIGSNAERFYTEPSERDRFQRHISQTDSVKDFEVKLERRDGTVMDCLLTSSVQRDDSGTITHYHGIIRDITERKRLKEQLEKRALHDWLTGLPNRELLQTRLDEAISRAERHDEAFVIAFIDLDHFKEINDTFGHEAGDRLLEESASRLEAVFRHEDTVARVGGDEFIILLEHFEEESEKVIPERLEQVFGPPFDVRGQQLHLEASIGMSSRIGHQHSSELESASLMRAADRAMYRAKSEEGTTYHRFTPDGESRESSPRPRGLQRAHRLRRALQNDDIVRYYRPVVHIVSGAICGVELVARWHRSDRDPLEGSELLELAEHAGLLEPMTRHLMRGVREDWQILESRCFDTALPNLMLPVDDLQFDKGALDAAFEALDGHVPLPPDQIGLHIPESQLMGQHARVSELDEAGYCLMVDNFGMGYSSLNYLKELELDGLTIHRSFVRDVRHSASDRAVVKAGVTLGRQLDLNIIADGVESSAHLDALKSHGCEFVQGKTVGPAMLPDTLESRLETDDELLSIEGESASVD